MIATGHFEANDVVPSLKLHARVDFSPFPEIIGRKPDRVELIADGEALLGYQR